MSPPKILLVEDEEDYRVLVKRALSREGFSVVVAETGAEGLKAFAEEKPDLVLLDAQLPDMDGFEVCRRIREGFARPRTPVVFCTVRSAVHRVSEGLGLGGDDYVLKPFKTADLVARVRAALAASP